MAQPGCPGSLKARVWIGNAEITGHQAHRKIVSVRPAIGITWFVDEEARLGADAMAEAPARPRATPGSADRPAGISVSGRTASWSVAGGGRLGDCDIANVKLSGQFGFSKASENNSTRETSLSGIGTFWSSPTDRIFSCATFDIEIDFQSVVWTPTAGTT